MYTIDTLRLTICFNNTEDERLLVPFRAQSVTLEGGALIAVLEEVKPGLGGARYRKITQAWPLSSIRWWKQEAEGY